MKKQKLQDVKILIDEYDEMIFDLSRDSSNVSKIFFWSLLISITIVLIIISFFLKYKTKDIINYLSLIYFSIIFSLCFFYIYNFKSVTGLNKILNKIRTEYKVSQETSIIDNLLINLGAKQFKIPKKLFWIFYKTLNYKQICEIFYYKIYLKYEINDIDNLKKELKKIMETKRKSKNIIIELLRQNKIESLIVTTLGLVINTYINENLKAKSVTISNNFFFFILFVLILTLILLYIISNKLMKDEIKFQIQKLKIINNCIDNFKIIKTTEIINKAEEQQEIYKKINHAIENDEELEIDNELFNKITENFEKITKEYLNSYKNENREEYKRKKMIDLYNSIKIEKELYEKNELTKVSKKMKNQQQAYEEVNEIIENNRVLESRLCNKINKNFSDVVRDYLNKYRNENNQERIKMLLISMEIEKEVYRNENTFKIEKEEQKKFYKNLNFIITVSMIILGSCGIFWSKQYFKDEIRIVLHNSTNTKLKVTINMKDYEQKLENVDPDKIIITSFIEGKYILDMENEKDKTKQTCELEVNSKLYNKVIDLDMKEGKKCREYEPKK